MTGNGEPKKRILILDDEPHVVTYLETLLRDHGYETSSAPNGKEGFVKARSERPDLICLDMSMPVESGVRFYRDLKGDPDLSKIPVIVVTAVTGYGGDPKAFKNFLGSRKKVPAPEGFFSKPIDRDEFISTVRTILQGVEDGGQSRTS